MTGAVLTMVTLATIGSLVTGGIQHTPLTSRDIEIILSSGHQDMIKVDGDCVLTPRNFTNTGTLTNQKSVLTNQMYSQAAAASARPRSAAGAR